ncbi:hypothetical protein Bcav_1790 [Beutenbergia cavernae DSM 12333]|uniref:Uncharacterized protein n=2 Tax=Beutenbergia TaxID=84756 RepID=C5C4R8_BEUC1|nr:hypothetical protein Bcav_1790 [Beutenbergia cavernae DSM 12333]
MTDGGWAVVTPHALVLVIEDGGAWQVRDRRGWHEVDHADWAPEPPSIHVRWIEGDESALGLVSDERAFPTALRERVESSIVLMQERDLPGGAKVRVAIRRAEDDSLLSQVSVVGRLRGTASEQAAIDALERDARAAAGLEP